MNDRQHTIRAYHRFWVDLDLKSGMPDPVAEGQQVTFTLERGRFSNAFEPLEVQVRTWEPNRRAADGANPSEQVHTIIFPAVPMTELFVVYVNRTETFTVTTTDDGVIEASDFLEVKILKSVDGKHNSRDKTRVRILDDDRPTISLAADATSITEGEPVTFTLTRVNTTVGELIVGVTVDDPDGFLEGNDASEAVEVPSSVVFAPGEVTKEVTLTPPDDYRDIPDSALTFTVAAEPGYEIVGPASLTVQVADNDVAPQVADQLQPRGGGRGGGPGPHRRPDRRTQERPGGGTDPGPGRQPEVQRYRFRSRAAIRDHRLQSARRSIQGSGHSLPGHPAPRESRILGAYGRDHHKRSHPGQRPLHGGRPGA